MPKGQINRLASKKLSKRYPAQNLLSSLKNVMNNEKFNIIENVEQLSVSICGEISAETVFPEIALKPQQKKVLLILDDAGYVNSSGIQGWIAWISGMQRSNSNLQFSIQMLPPNFARLSHHIRDFLPKDVKVESFVAPYYCANCNASFSVVFKNETNWKTSWTPKELATEISKAKCAKCETIADIDTVAEAYEKFQHRPVSIAK